MVPPSWAHVINRKASSEDIKLAKVHVPCYIFQKFIQSKDAGLPGHMDYILFIAQNRKNPEHESAGIVFPENE